MEQARHSPNVALSNAKDFVRETQRLLDPWLTGPPACEHDNALGETRIAGSERMLSARS